VGNRTSAGTNSGYLSIAAPGSDASPDVLTSTLSRPNDDVVFAAEPL
jgi:hypothetical protein